ncbi:MAG: PQQ-binding-like beta-propeller repeat protein [Candidatus Marinimicrobia bacterium]|nr:PQQ-binding-like beta-propeller repeat protein [Candidatus Neomarinimicrobiota bacterium]
MTIGPAAPDSASSLANRLGRRLAVVSGIFLMIVSSIMLLNGYLLRAVDPLDSPALRTLSAQLAQDADNAELRQQVRELDLLARRAFFVRQWQIRTGGILLAVAGLVFIVSLYLMTAGNRRLPDLKRCPGLAAPWSGAARARRMITVGGVLLMMAAWGVYLIAGREALVSDPSPAVTETGVLPPSVAAAPVEAPAGSAAFRRHWPAFRGPGGLGWAPDAEPPIAWDGRTGEGVRWKAEVPRRGFNSPVVWGARVFLTGADEQTREVYCYDADTGALLWTAGADDVPGAPGQPPKVTADTGYAAPSVAVDGQRVIAIFGTGVILGLDFEGRRLWARYLGTPDNLYGHASSLLIWHDTVFVQFDHFGGAQLMALEVETGRTRWTRPRAADTSWASPILVESAGRMNLILAAAPMVAAYDALTGEERWSRDVLSGEIGSSPAYAGGRVFVANQYAQAVALNADTGLTYWATPEMELPDAGSPVATDRYLFLPTSYGVFSCVDATDGTVVWEHEFAAGGYGSPILAGDRLYWVTEEGQTRIFKAAGTFELIAEPALGEPSVCTPAFVGRRLYIRGDQHLFCIGSE